ncbi:MAG: glycosyltransferase family 25 protein [Acidocella sp.]|nr:glycosyltransferase family 25 protein [Acidocella sp.]
MLSVFIITLAQETERQAKIAARLEKFGMAYEFFPAVHKDMMSPADRRFYNSRRRRLALGKDLYDGEIACLLSHKRLIEKIAREKIAHAIILEDDCVMCDEFPSIIGALLARTDLWHLVRFFGNEKHEQRPHRKLTRLVGGFSLVRIATSPGEAHCYVLDQFAAQKIAHVLNNTSTPIDILLGQPWKTHLGVLTVYPKVAWQDAGHLSAIGDERFSGKLHVTGAEKFAFRIVHPFYVLRNTVFKKLWYFAMAIHDWQVAHRARRDASAGR